MSRITACFAQLQAQRKTALIPFITAGDPTPASTVGLMHHLVAQGADILELGVPFSDPMADGPVIQLASERALAQGMNLRRVLAMVAEFRATNTQTPVVLMGYLNPIEAMGYPIFATEAQQAEVDGLLTVDAPPEECQTLADCLQAAQIDPIFLLAPTSNSARIAQITQIARGFVYYVALKGVTGAATLDVAQVKDKLTMIRAQTILPVGVGFGIKDAAAAQAIAAIADAVVVGSALVSRIAEYADQPDQAVLAAGTLLAELRTAIDAVDL